MVFSYNNNMEKYSVSVIIPVYNVERYLSDCLDSIISQTLQEIEIICINDGSTDSSLFILRKYAERDPRIRIIEQPNLGLSAARNTGARAAKGKYLYFIDSDDFLDPSALQILYDSMEQRSLDAIRFRSTAFGNDPESSASAKETNRFYFQKELNGDKVFSGPDSIPELVSHDTLIAFTWLSMVKRSFFLENELWFHPGVLYEDQAWTFAVFLHAERVGFVNEALHHYRKRADSITGNSPKPDFRQVYGWFCASVNAQKTIVELQEKMSPELYDLCISLVLRMQQTAAENYSKCSQKEKDLRKELPADERISFEKEVILYSDLIHEVQKINSSETYRVGKVICWLPIMIKDRLKALLSRPK